MNDMPRLGHSDFAIQPVPMMPAAAVQLVRTNIQVFNLEVPVMVRAKESGLEVQAS